MESNTTNLDSETLVNYFYDNLFGLSKIEEGFKIYVTPDNIITPDEPYMFQGLWRYYNNISRSDAILVISKLFDNIERYYNSLYIKTCIIKNKQNKINMPEPIIKEYILIIEKINNSLYGIKNLKITYKDDTTIIKELDTIIETINKMVTHFTTISSKTYID
jgi:hypothetical protein